MKYNNEKELWGFDENNLESTDVIKDIIMAQCDYLKERTSGKVIADFSEKYSSLSRSFEYLTNTIPSFASSIPIDTDSDSDLKDANDLFCKEVYQFEIRTNTYRFRVFDIIMKPVYPVYMRPDEDIVFEIQRNEKFLLSEIKVQANNYLELRSEDEFRFVLKAVLSSKKIIYLINKLIEDTSKA